MLGWNAYLFIVVQFGSRFVNSFLTTAARYELLEVGGVKRFASAQVATQVARVFMQQTAGLLTDNYPLKKLYVAGEATNLILVAALLPMLYTFGPGALFAVNVGLGLTQAFSQPVAKSLPPAVVPVDDLAVVNSWDLTGDKIGRNLAPVVLTVVSSALGFEVAILIALLCCLALVALKQVLRVSDPPLSENGNSGASDRLLKGSSGGSSVLGKLVGVFRQVWEGIMSLKSDRTIALLILNTLVTNMLVYPLGSVVFPVIFKAIPEGAIEEEGSSVSRMILSLQSLVGIQKDKAWMNYAALVSLGGVIGPFLSNMVVYQIRSMVSKCPEQATWIGLNCGMAGQVLTLLWLMSVLSALEHFSAGTRILLLFIVWGAMTALNNVTTIYFNAHTQHKLSRQERGRFIANILMLFTLANSVGSLMYGWALAQGGFALQLRMSTRLLMAALIVRMMIFAAFRLDAKGRETVIIKHD